MWQLLLGHGRIVVEVRPNITPPSPHLVTAHLQGPISSHLSTPLLLQLHHQAGQDAITLVLHLSNAHFVVNRSVWYLLSIHYSVHDCAVINLLNEYFDQLTFNSWYREVQYCICLPRYSLFVCVSSLTIIQSYILLCLHWISDVLVESEVAEKSPQNRLEDRLLMPPPPVFEDDSPQTLPCVSAIINNETHVSFRWLFIPYQGSSSG